VGLALEEVDQNCICISPLTVNLSAMYVKFQYVLHRERIVLPLQRSFDERWVTTLCLS
jgi:hypothetical protein